jgi:EAL domain-containing protein (putative c-di-GMP-specific phosphodiesterase class I)
VNVENLRRLRERGFNLAIDDFGVGHSALRYFKEFPVNAVKIDRSFVSGLGVDRTDTAIVHAMVGFAKALDLRVTAEGVENVRQMAQLQSLGIQMAQGYLFGRPNTHEHLEALLRAGRAPNWAADTKLAAAYGLRSKGPKLLPAV